VNAPGKLDDDYLAWLRRQPCVGIGECGQGIEAHHVTGRGMGGSKQDDRDTVPLCRPHHQILHDSAEFSPLSAEETKAYLMGMAHRLLKRYIDEEVLNVFSRPNPPRRPLGKRVL
jgi:hypothetical protein